MESDTSIQRIANLLGAAALAIEDRISRAVVGAGVSREEASVLVTVSGTSGLTIRDVSEILGMSHPGTVRLVLRLVHRGAVEKRTGRDKREAHLLLTDVGRDMVARILRAREETLVSLVERVEPRYRRVFESTIEEVLRSLVTTDLDTFRICRLCDEGVCDQRRCPVERCYEGRWP